MRPLDNNDTLKTRSQSERRPDIDWLRIFAVVLLVPYHAALIFNPDPNSIVYVPKQAIDPILVAFVTFTHRWHMPLLFVLAGMSAWFALQRRTPKAFITERCQRLGIPFTFGVVVLIPLMLFLYMWAITGTLVPLWDFYVGFFTRNPGDLSGYNGTFTPAHLWFILFLLVFSIAGLAFMLHILKVRHTNAPEVKTPVKVKLPIIVLLVPAVLVTLTSALPAISDKNPFSYFCFFYCGFITASYPAYQGAIDRVAKWAFAFGVGTVVVDYLFFPNGLIPWSIEWILEGLSYNMGRWFLVVGILGFGHRYLNKERHMLSYLREAAYPFYILHMPMLTLVGIVLIQVSLPPLFQFSFISVITVLTTFVIYEVFIRRNKIGRFLFGMKPGVSESGKVVKTRLFNKGPFQKQKKMLLN